MSTRATLPSLRPQIREKEDKNVSFRPPQAKTAQKKEKEENTSLSTLLDLCRTKIAQKMEEERLLAMKDIEAILEEALLQKQEEEQGDLGLALPTTLFSPLSSSYSGTATAPAGVISAQALELFDTLCCELLVMDMEGSSKTTLFLQNEAFIDSPFFGAEITLEEFSTAPKMFNVSICAKSEAVALIQAHMAGFMELLQDRKFSFGINRIDTDLLLEERYFREDDGSRGDSGEDPNDQRHS